MEFTGGITVTLTMHGHSHIDYRTTRIEGTRGRLLAEFGDGGSCITVDEHRSGRSIHYNTSSEDRAGHGGGDFALISAFLESIQSGGAAGRDSAARTTARQALSSHLMAFAAEQSRLEGQVMGAEMFQ